MQKIIIIGALFFIQAVLGQTKNNDIVFKNVNIISMLNDQVLKNQDVAVKDGKIVAIENSKTSKLKGDKIVDLKGKYLLPSLADSHVHLPENEAEMERFLKLNLINGVTKLRSMRGDWKHKEWKEKYNTKDSYFPRLYLSAPAIGRTMEATAAQLETFVKTAKEKGFGSVKILSIKNQETFVKLDSLCKKYELPMSGHFPRLAMGSALNEAVFFNSAYKSIEHLGGLVGEPVFFESRLKSIKENNIFICPTLAWYSIGSGQHSYEELQKLPGMEFVSKETLQGWMEKTKQYRDKIGEQAYKEEVAKELKDLEEKFQVINRLQKEGIKMILSPDASSIYMMAGFNMITEMELLKKANLSNFEILQMATTNFAQFHNENNGVLEVGKEADFIVLEGNPLENLEALKNVKGLYFNSNYLSETLLEIKNSLLFELNK